MGKLRLSFKFGGNLLSELWRELPDGIELSGKGKKEGSDVDDIFCNDQTRTYTT